MAAWVEGREERLGLREPEKKKEGNPEEIGAKRMRENQRRWARIGDGREKGKRGFIKQILFFFYNLATVGC